MLISDAHALEDYIKGGKSESSLYIAGHFNAWLIPVLIWSVFICLLMFVMMCINTIFRQHWMNQERLGFPITQLPNEIANPDSGFFKNKLFLISCAVVGIINIINGLHFLLPQVPYLRVTPYDLGVFFTDKPWDAMGYMPFLSLIHI